MAFHYLLDVNHLFLEGLESFPLLSFERNPDEGVTGNPQGIVIQQKSEAFEKAAFFQYLHPAKTGRLRETDLVGQLDIGELAVMLENRQDSPVNVIEAEFRWILHIAPQREELSAIR